jgi:hypothetical protein
MPRHIFSWTFLGRWANNPNIQLDLSWEKETDMKQHPRNLLLVTLIAGIFLTAGAVWAGPKLFDSGLDTSTDLNSGAVTIDGIYTHDQNTSDADPFGFCRKFLCVERLR